MENSDKKEKPEENCPNLKKYPKLSKKKLKKRDNLIFCFICGIAYRQRKFISHYSSCKSAYNSYNYEGKSELIEPENFDIFLEKINNHEDIQFEQSIYNSMVEQINFELIKVQCKTCQKKIHPNNYIKHYEKENNINTLTKFEEENIKLRKKIAQRHSKNIAHLEKKFEKEQLEKNKSHFNFKVFKNITGVPGINMSYIHENFLSIPSLNGGFNSGQGSFRSMSSKSENLDESMDSSDI